MILKPHARIDWTEFERAAPEVVAALRALGMAVDLTSARKLPIAPAKLDLVATWREAGAFSARERAALAWTEAVTLMAVQPVADVIYGDLQSQFSATEIMFLTAAIGTINAWNRIAGALQFSV